MNYIYLLIVLALTVQPLAAHHPTQTPHKHRADSLDKLVSGINPNNVSITDTLDIAVKALHAVDILQRYSKKEIFARLRYYLHIGSPARRCVSQYLSQSSGPCSDKGEHNR